MPAQQTPSRPFTSVREFLKSLYDNQKKANPRFSHRYISQKIGAQSSGWFSDILAGRQRIKPRYVQALESVFHMDALAKAQFKTLLSLEEAETPEQKSAAYEDWCRWNAVSFEELTADKAAYFDHWYYPAIRELILQNPHRNPTPEWVSQALVPSISRAQARKALSVLNRLGLLQPEFLGLSPNLVKSAGSSSLQWIRLQKAYIQLARQALGLHRKHERNFSGITLNLSDAAYEKAVIEIANLRKRLLTLSQLEPGKARVFQCLFQVFPLTRAQEKG